MQKNSSTRGSSDQPISDKFVSELFSHFQSKLIRSMSKLKAGINSDFQQLQEEMQKCASSQEKIFREIEIESISDRLCQKVSEKDKQLLNKMKVVYEQGMFQFKRHIKNTQDCLSKKLHKYYESILDLLRQIIKEELKSEGTGLSKDHIEEKVGVFKQKVKRILVLKDILTNKGRLNSDQQQIRKIVQNINLALEQMKTVEQLTIQQVTIAEQISKCFGLSFGRGKQVLQKAYEEYLSN